MALRRASRMLRSGVVVVLGCATLVGGGALITGAGSGLENALASARAALTQRPASGQVVIVEVDADSVSRLDRWPWPRSLYAAAVDRLRVAGVRSIAFDLDFSARSSASEDRALAAALRRAGGSVVLPTFRQQGSRGDESWIDNLPIPALRDASFLAAVNVFPEADGVVRESPLGVTTRDVPRPSIAAMLAERNGASARSFPIDFAIDPASIPRIGFADLIAGKIDGARLRGKRILIGGTAIELGDRYAVPVYGIVPGVVIQALATETLMRHGVPVVWSGALPLLLVILVSALLARRSSRARIVGAACTTALLLGVPIAGGTAGIVIAVAPALLAVLVVLAGEVAMIVRNELAHRRFVDRETELPNRAAMVVATRIAGARVVTVARFDRFHELTTALGHVASARLIAAVAARTGAALNVQVHRVEEGAIAWLALPLGRDEDEDGHFAGLFQLLHHPVTLGGAMIDVRPTFGIAALTAGQADETIAGALVAAQRARLEGARWRRFVADDGTEQRRRLALLSDLSGALATGGIWVAYQPKFGIAEGRIIGAEALVRWRHPERGAVPPDSFIPLIEQEGRAAELTAFVLDRALADLAQWRAAGHAVTVAVNISATLLDDPALVPMIRTALARNPVDPAALTLELTESAIIAHPDAAAARLAELRALGLKLSIDDYGTGQSTLSYLKRVPASELKIDKSFVQAIGKSAHDDLLVRSTIELAHALGITVVAEGVEDETCLSALRTLGCDTVQGWHTGRPMPAAEFTALLATSRRTDDGSCERALADAAETPGVDVSSAGWPRRMHRLHA